MSLTPEDRAVLESRARDLAKPVRRTDASRAEWLHFRLGRERCAIAARWVHEVVRTFHEAPLPGSTPPATAIASWRGTLIPVIDLHGLLGVAREKPGPLTRLVVLGRGEAQCAVRVDEVDGMDIVAAPVLPPEQGVSPRRDYVEGVMPGAVLVVAAERLLDLEP